MSLSNFSTLLITLGSFYFTYFEFSSTLNIFAKKSLEKSINEVLPELKFLSQSEKENKVNRLIEQSASITSPPFDHDSTFQLGKLLLLSGLETKATDKKLNNICEAREQLTNAAKSSPRNINYQLAIADIESISPSLISTCDSLENVASSSVSLRERLQWIEFLAPSDPPVLYKKGIIERSIGARIEAMQSFRKFEENSLFSLEQYRRFLISQAQNEIELKELLPRKYPNLLNWALEYSKNPNPNISYQKIFEEVFIELISKLENDNKLDSKQELQTLYNMYWFSEVQHSEPVKQVLAKLIFKIVSLHSTEAFPKDFFGSLINLNKTPMLLSTSFSGVSKRSTQIYDWVSSTNNTQVNLDIRSGGIGVFLPANSRPEKMIVQGGKNDKSLSGLKATIWVSEDNVNFVQTEDIKSFKTGNIDNRPIAIFNVANLNSKYFKIFFSLDNDRTQRLIAPASLIIQFYSGK